MKKKTAISDDETLGHWQSIADVMTALLLIVLLINMALILYISRIPEDIKLDNAYGDRYDDYDVVWDPDTEDNPGWNGATYPETEPQQIIITAGGGGGGYEEHHEEDVPETVPFEFHAGEGTDKAAVYVMVIDAETEKTIKQKGIEFELFDRSNAQLTLRTYYPTTVEYRIFETRPEGVFFLPEKIVPERYYLRELTEPDGYDAAEDQAFEISGAYDWPEPLVLKVPLYPSRNVIRLSMTDADSGAPVGGGVYEVTAAEPIVTADGTVRYTLGQVADVITLDENGLGESTELFLGRYTVRQITTPEYYASDEETLEVDVEKKQGSSLSALQEMTCRKTAVSVSVMDALYNNIPISGAEFRLHREGTSEEEILATDRFGRIHISNLQKNTRYALRQISTDDPYWVDDTEYAFSVDSTGRIENEIQTETAFYNRVVRASFGVRDVLVKKYASDYNVVLRSGADEVIAAWNTTAMAHEIEGLEPGIYYMVVGGNEKSKKMIEISPDVEIQRFDYSVWTNESLALAISCGVILTIVLAVVLAAIRRKVKK